MIQLENAVSRFKKLILDELYNNNINCWVAGGSIRDYFMGLSVKTDYDLFFPDEDNFKKCETYFKSKGCIIKWESENGLKVVYNDKVFDLVKKFFKTPKEAIDNFDFTVSMFAIDKDNVYYGESSFIDLAKKQLMINKITFPASTLSRSFRYHKKGFTMCNGEMVKLIESIQEMPKVETTNGEDNGGEDISSGDFGGLFFGFD